MRCGGCMLRIDREIWFYEDESRESARPVAFEQSRIVIRIGRRISPEYSNPQTEVRARTPRTRWLNPVARRARRRNQLTLSQQIERFVDWCGERVQCPNLQRAHGEYLQWFSHILAASKTNSVVGRPIYSKITHAGFGIYRFLEEILDRLIYLRAVLLK